MAFRRNSLDGSAAQILWDYSPQEVDNVKKLTTKIRQRFGDSMQQEKCKVKLKDRRRQPEETLQQLHSDIRRLTMLAFPELEKSVREVTAPCQK